METDSTIQVNETGHHNRAGAPKHNANSRTHGVYSLVAARRGGKVDKRTSFGKAFERRKAEYVSHLGGDQLSAMELTIIEDTVWTDFYIAAYDAYLSSLKSIIRKGRPHPIVDARTRLGVHRRDNLRVLSREGLKRALPKIETLEAILEEASTDEAK